MENIYQKNKEIFGRIGLIATQFSTLDFFVSETISVLISPKVPIIDTILTENMFFSKKLDCLKKIAEFVLYTNKKEKELLFEMINNAKEYSEYRNIFLHGLAIIAPEDLQKGFIKYQSTKLHRIKDMEKESVILHYERLKEKKFELSELKTISHSLGKLCDNWVQFIKHAKEIIKKQSTKRNKKKKGVSKVDQEGINQLELDMTMIVQKIKT